MPCMIMGPLIVSSSFAGGDVVAAPVTDVAVCATLADVLVMVARAAGFGVSSTDLISIVQVRSVTSVACCEEWVCTCGAL